MADETTVERLSLEISSNSSGAAKGIDKLASTLKALKEAVDFDSGSVAALKDISAAVSGLSALNGLKISSSVPKQLTAIGDAVRGLYGIQTADVTEVAVSLKQLGDVGDISIGPVVNQLKKLPEAAEGLKSIDAEDFRERISIIASAVAPLSNLEKNNLTSYITQLGKLPDIVEKLDDEKLDEFAEKIKKATEAVRPLGTEMEKVSNGFSAFPTRIQRLVSQNERLTTSNGRVSRSYTDLHHMVGDALNVVERGGRAIANLINKENEYIENINLFNASMREYAQEAQDYANTVGEVMGIDPGEWMRNRGVFMTLLTGFEVAGDRAALMSQQLTQLGYDLSSFYNISFADSMQKLQSGISGELEPLRRLGYDLSQAKLQQIALNLEIDKNVASMNQAEKAQLRYYAILTQVTTAQGDMARTLNAPANQLRIFNSQTEQAGRALGSIFIPTLNALLPYGIAAAKVVRILATEIAALAGFELPEVDYSGLGDYTGGVADDLESATESAKELKRTLLGIDEINRLGDSSGNGAGDLGSSGGLNFELPTYDFLEGAVNSRVNEIVEEMKEWLGITEDIDSWAELMDTRFGSILKTVGLIGGGLLTWKIGEGLISGLKWLTQTLEGNLTLSVTGFTIEALGAYDIGKNGADLKNVLETVLGGAAGTLGLTLLGLKIGGTTGGLVGLTLGLGIAFTVGAIAYQKGKKAAEEERFWASEFGQYLSEVKKKIEEANELTLEIKTRIELRYENLEEVSAAAKSYKGVADELYKLVELESLMPDDLVKIHSLVDILNDSGALGEIKLEYDEVAGSISLAKDEVYNLIDAWKEQALQSAALESLKEAYKDYFDQKANLEMLEEQSAELDSQLHGLYEESTRFYNDEYTAAKKAFDEASEAIGGTVGYTYQKIIGGNDELIKSYEDARTELESCTRTNRDYETQIEHLRDEVIPEHNLALDSARQTAKDLEVQIGYLSDVAGNAESALTEFGGKVRSEFDGLPSAARSAADGIQIAFSPLLSVLDSLIEKNRELREGAALGAQTNTYSGMLKSGGITPPRFASGGFPEKGEMFIAREQGPELVGKIGGQTAVMNNGQIVQSVASGVRDANAEQNALLREQNSLLRKLLEKEFTASVSAQEIQRGMARSNRIVGKTVVPVG